jgi:hypothetical protein
MTKRCVSGGRFICSSFVLQEFLKLQKSLDEIKERVLTEGSIFFPGRWGLGGFSELWTR